MQVENFGTAWLDFDFAFPCDIHFSFIKPIRADRFKVLLLACEPEPIRVSEAELATHWSRFDLIISHDKRHLQYPNVHLMTFWDTYVNDIPSTKRFEVSSMISIGGGPANMTGYQLRDHLYQRRGEFTIPNRFFISNRLPNWERFGLPILPDDKKDAMFTSMFHIAIENHVELDYFSEKLLDCFNSLTVPIYRGCLNTQEHGLDERAFIRFETIDECIAICNNLTVDDYNQRVSYLAANRQLRQSKGLWLDHVQQLIFRAWARQP
jgi:Glycosyltransferase family 10 (fucosyltransferase) C-term